MLPEEPRELPKFLSKEPPERQREIPVHDYDHAFVRQEEEGKGDNEAVHEPAQVVKKEENAPTEQESRELEEDISRALAEKGKKVYKKPSVSLLHPKQKSTRNTDRERQEVLATAKN